MNRVMIGEELDAIFAGDIFNHLVDEPVGQFRNRLGAARHDGAARRADNHQQEDAGNRQGKPEGDIGDCKGAHCAAGQGGHIELIHRVDRQSSVLRRKNQARHHYQCQCYVKEQLAHRSASPVVRC
jgi:hypothetical protein